MAIEVLYFAWVREAIGCGQERVDPPASVATLRDLAAWLAERGGGYRAALGDPAKLRAAIDQRFVGLDTPLGTAREVALFPPVTGG